MRDKQAVTQEIAPETEVAGSYDSRSAGFISRFGIPDFSWSLALLGLCIFTFAIVSYKWPVGDFGIAVALIGLVLQREKLRISPPVWFFGAFVLWAFIASFQSPYAEVARDKVVDYVKLFAIMVVAVNALRTEGQVRFYLFFFLACFILFPVRGTLVGGELVQGRAVWNYIYRNSNDLATLCILALGIALGFLFTETSRKMVKLGAIVSSFLLLAVMLLTQSRGAFGALAAGMGPAFIWSGLKRPVRFIIVIAVLIFLALQVAPSNFWDRLAGMEKLTNASTIADADPEGSAAERFEVQKIGWQIFMDRPMFGVGLGAYQFANAQYSPEIGMKDTHNTYLNLAAEVGAPGLVLWLLCFGGVLKFAYVSRKSAVKSALSIQQVWIERAFLSYLLAGFVGTYAKLTFPYLILAVLWCSATLLATATAKATAISQAKRQ